MLIVGSVALSGAIIDQAHIDDLIATARSFDRVTGTSKAIEDGEPAAESPDDEYPLWLCTGRILEHWHTGTMTMRTDGLNMLSPECFVEISDGDAGKLGIQNGEMVNVCSRRGRIKAKLKVSGKAVDGTIFIPFHFANAAANKLTNAELDPTAKIPEFKVCAINIEAAKA